MTRKVLFVSDFNIRHDIGGAQRSNEILIQYGKKLGHTIVEYNFDSPIDLLMDKYDVVISSNLEVISQRNPHIINILGSLPNHYRLEHDMNRYLTPDQRKVLFGNCQKTFFLTTYHHNLFVNWYGDIFKNVVIVYDPIDTTLFRNLSQERENKILYVGYMHEFKGTYNFFNYVFENPAKQFVMAAWGVPIFVHLATTIKNVQYLGKLDHDKMPELFNHYKYLYYQPNIDEPFCRSVGEALLCGIEGIFNDKIGCVHERMRVGPESFRALCHDAPKMFWSQIG